MPFDGAGPAKIYCTACGVPHHEDCYLENGGCTVFGCVRAPADDPKLQVSYGDLNAAAARTQQAVAAFQPQIAAPVQTSPSPYGGPLGLSQATATPAVANPEALLATQPLPSPEDAYALTRPPKSRTTFILLGVFLGMLGAHNFYAGYTGRAVGQLCLSVLTVGVLALASWIWAIVEICIVDKDGVGIQFS
jgi:TM2 domain-containing membrane protein YozV